MDLLVSKILPQFIYPLWLSIGLGILAGFMGWRRRRRLALAAGLLAVAFFGPRRHRPSLFCSVVCSKRLTQL